MHSMWSQIDIAFQETDLWSVCHLRSVLLPFLGKNILPRGIGITGCSNHLLSPCLNRNQVGSKGQSVPEVRSCHEKCSCHPPHLWSGGREGFGWRILDDNLDSMWGDDLVWHSGKSIEEDLGWSIMEVCQVTWSLSQTFCLTYPHK